MPEPAVPRGPGVMAALPRLAAVAGDWHGNAAWATRAIRRISARLAAGEPHLIVHLGDFGVWPDASGVAYLGAVEAALADAGMELWFIDGNHEDHSMLARLPPGRDGLRRVSDRIWHIPRGHRWTWHGRTWLALGGAVSVDAAERVRGRDWWPEEEITPAQAAAVAADGHAEVLVTHDCPAGVSHTFPPAPASWSRADLARNAAHRRRLQDVADAVRPRWLIHGHLHRSYQRQVDMGWGAVEVTGFSRDGTLYGNWAILDAAEMRWQRFEGSFLAGLARNLGGRIRRTARSDGRPNTHSA